MDSYTSPIEGTFIFLIYYLIYKAGLKAQKLMRLLRFEESLPSLWQHSVQFYIFLLAEIQESPGEVVASEWYPL